MSAFDLILRGGTVTLRIAKVPEGGAGPEAGVVPEVMGLRVSDAQNALLLAGYAVLTDYVTAPGKAAWVVFDQNPPAGTPATSAGWSGAPSATCCSTSGSATSRPARSALACASSG